MIEASVLPFDRKYGTMISLFEHIFSSVTPQEQQALQGIGAWPCRVRTLEHMVFHAFHKRQAAMQCA
jgi:hypothetical protein